MKKKSTIVIITCMLLTLTMIFTGCGGKTLSNKEWWKKINELYEAKELEEHENAKVYLDGIRGGASYHPNHNGEVRFDYTSMNGNEITLYLDPKKDVARFEFLVKEGEDRFYAFGDDVSFEEMPTYVDGIIAGKQNYDAYNNSAMENHPELVKSDLKILYARFVLLWNEAFSDIIPVLKNNGIDLGERYGDVDATQPTSTEVVIKNEHVFENGICKDCGMTWTKYMNGTLAKFNGAEVKENAVETDWFSSYGQKSEECGYYVQYSTDDVREVELLLMDDSDPVRRCSIEVRQKDDSTSITVYFSLEEGLESIDTGLLGAKYHFTVQVTADPERLSEIFSSKEAFREACFLDLLTTDKNNYLIRGWEEMTDEELKKMLKADKCEYYTKDEFVDLFWEQHERMFLAIDKGMVWYDTTLKDVGIQYK